MTDLVYILDSVLGPHKRTRSSEYYYTCKFCHHYKPKLAVNVHTGQWHCWVCGVAGRSIMSLLRRLNVPQSLHQEVRALIKPAELSPTIEIAPPVVLPDEWQPLWSASSLIGRRAKRYVLDRGMTEGDMIRYNIGYCATGKFAHRIILPSYDASGVLNYFTGRDYTGDAWLKYLNPEASKDIIGFEMFINWNHPVILVEGFFDAIATRWNAIPLIGSIVSHALYNRLLAEQVPVYIALDDDALRKTSNIALKLIKQSIPVYHVKLDGHDPSEIGFVHMRQLIQSASALSYSDALTLKLQTI
jgi:DNA primase